MGDGGSWIAVPSFTVFGNYDSKMTCFPEEDVALSPCQAVDTSLFAASKRGVNYSTGLWSTHYAGEQDGSMVLMFNGSMTKTLVTGKPVTFCFPPLCWRPDSRLCWRLLRGFSGKWTMATLQTNLGFRRQMSRLASCLEKMIAHTHGQPWNTFIIRNRGVIESIAV